MCQQKTKWPQVLQEMSTHPPSSELSHNSDHKNNTPCVGTKITKFLVKKELLLSRLSAFNIKSENYLIWKRTFSIIIIDLSVTPMDYLDLPAKYLGPDSR